MASSSADAVRTMSLIDITVLGNRDVDRRQKPRRGLPIDSSKVLEFLECCMFWSLECSEIIVFVNFEEVEYCSFGVWEFGSFGVLEI